MNIPATLVFDGMAPDVPTPLLVPLLLSTIAVALSAVPEGLLPKA